MQESSDLHEEGRLVKGYFLPWLSGDVCEHIFLAQRGVEMQSVEGMASYGVLERRSNLAADTWLESTVEF